MCTQLQLTRYLYSCCKDPSVFNSYLLRNDAQHWSIKKIALASLGASLELTSCILATATIALTCFYSMTVTTATVPSLACIVSCSGYVNNLTNSKAPLIFPRLTKALLILSRLIVIGAIATAMFSGMTLGSITASIMLGQLSPSISFASFRISEIIFEYLKVHSNVELHREENLLELLEQPEPSGMPFGILISYRRQKATALIELINRDSEKRTVQARLLTDLAHMPATLISIIQAYENPLKPIICQFIEQPRFSQLSQFLNQSSKVQLLNFIHNNHTHIEYELEKQVQLIIASSLKLHSYPSYPFFPRTTNLKLVLSLPARCEYWNDCFLGTIEQETLSALQELYKFHREKGSHAKELMTIIKSCFKFMFTLQKYDRSYSLFSVKIAVELHNKGALSSDAALDNIKDILFNPERFSDLFFTHYVLKKVQDIDENTALDAIFQTLLSAWNSQEHINRFRDEVIMHVFPTRSSFLPGPPSE